MRTRSKDITWSTADPGLPVSSRTIYHYQFIEVPAMVQHTFLRKDRLSFFAGAGVSLDVFVNKRTTVKVEYSNEHTGSHASSTGRGYSRIAVFGAIGAGARYAISKRYSLTLEPFFERSVSSLILEEGAREYLFSYGIKTSLVRNLHSQGKR